MNDLVGGERSDVLDAVVWFSCGVASAVAAKLTVDEHPDWNVRIACMPIANEHPDNMRFLRDVEAWVGQPFEMVRHPKYPAMDIMDVFRERRYMSNARGGAVCTLTLKKEARRFWEQDHDPRWHVLGYTVEEKRRHDRFVAFERENLLPVLIDHNLTKQDCAWIVMAAGIKPPKAYEYGMPNANCIGCVKASSPTYWNLIRKHWPDKFAEMAALSREIGCRLVRHKGERIFLDELPADAKGASLKSLDFECGIFCEEPWDIVKAPNPPDDEGGDSRL